MEELIISAALTGAWPTKQHNPNISMAPEEIAEDAFGRRLPLLMRREIF